MRSIQASLCGGCGEQKRCSVIQDLEVAGTGKSHCAPGHPVRAVLRGKEILVESTLGVVSTSLWYPVGVDALTMR